MRKYKVRIYNQCTGLTTYDFVYAYTWAEAEVKASIQFYGRVTEVINIELD